MNCPTAMTSDMPHAGAGASITHRSLLRTALQEIATRIHLISPKDPSGPTVYAIRIPSGGGQVTLEGPAISSRRNTETWPAVARDTSLAVFERHSIRQAGAVTVIALIERETATHCMLISLPAQGWRMGQETAGEPADCAPHSGLSRARGANALDLE